MSDTQTTNAVKTPAWMTPEQTQAVARGAQQAHSDATTLAAEDRRIALDEVVTFTPPAHLTNDYDPAYRPMAMTRGGSFEVTDSDALAIADRLANTLKACGLCGEPMTAGQQFQHNECARLVESGATIDHGKKHWLSDNYKEYLKSPQWKRTRRRLIRAAGGKCGTCDATGNLHAHHVTYARLGNEAPDDILILCESCHKAEHGRIDRKRERHHMDARFGAWVRKFKGEEYDYTDEESLWQQFEAFLDRQDGIAQ